MLLLLTVFAACDGDYAQPPLILPEGGLGNGTYDNPRTALQVLNGASSTEESWVTGYIVGWIDTSNSNTMNAETCMFTAPATSQLNLLIANNPDETNYENCVPVQLPTGAIRTALNLKDNPSNLGKQITILGMLQSYFSHNGVKSVSMYNWGDQGIEGYGPGNSTDNDNSADDSSTTGGSNVYKKVTSITSGKTYAMVANGNAALNITSGNYGWLNISAVTDNNGEFTSTEKIGFVFTATEGGWTISQTSDNRYLYMTGTYNSFNLSDTAVEGAVFTAEAQSDGSFKITNVAMSKYIQLSTQYSSYGAYTSENGVMPALYEKQ